jgi:hypothetical protein
MQKLYFFFVASIISLSLSSQVGITLGPYLQSPTPGSIKIKWRTDVPTASKIMYGSSVGSLTSVAEDLNLDTIHTVKISGLSSFTKYYYAIYDGSTLVEGNDNRHWFRTNPDSGTVMPIRVWAIGDFGKGNTEQAQVRESYLNYSGNTETNVWMWMGDNVYNDGLFEEYRTKVFDSVSGYKNIMSYMPFMPCPGNHDYNSISPVTSPKPPLQHTGPYYDIVDVPTQGEAGGVASGNELYYSYNYGNVHFISMNSEIGSLFTAADDWTGVRLFGTFTGSQFTQWLHADLQANRQPWVIAYFHQPPFTDGSHESTAFYEVFMKAMRVNFAPILEQYGVDLVVCGHTHVYERSYLLNGFYGLPADYFSQLYALDSRSGNDDLGEAYTKYTQGPNANKGTVYVNNGNSGSKETDANLQHPAMYYGYGCDTCVGSFVIDINGNRLDGRHVDSRGVVRDYFTIKKVDAASGVNELNSNGIISKFNVYPNPFNDRTTVSFTVETPEEISVMMNGVDGKEILLERKSYTTGEQTIEIDAEYHHLSKGVYVVRILNSGTTLAKTVVKIK